MTVKLIYTGRGDALIGIPARDLTVEDLERIGHEFTWESLINSGLYKRPDAEKIEEKVEQPKKTKAAKDGK